MNRYRDALVVAVVVLSTWVLPCAQPASAIVIYDESIHGDLPDDPLLAPLIPLPPVPAPSIFATWSVIGSVGELDIDEFGFVVPPGHRVADIRLGSALPPPGSSPVRFRLFHVIDRSVHTTYEGPTDMPTSITELTPVSGDPIDPPSLYTPGTFGMKIKADVDPAYTIDFVLERVPEPGTLTLLALSGAALLRRRS